MSEKQNQQRRIEGIGSDLGSVPNSSESFGNLPKSSETFRTVRNDSETFGTLPNPSARKENHTLTVREVARMFESAGVARTERSIINWCQLNRMGVARLDAYFDPNEHKYFITLDSVNAAIQEELSRAAKQADQVPPAESIPKTSETVKEEKPKVSGSQDSNEEMKSLRQENYDLKITNRAKDFFIEQLKKERQEFDVERQGYVEKLMVFNRQVGELETKLLALEAPKETQQTPLEKRL